MPDAPPPLFEQLQTLTTETRNPRTTHIDTAPLNDVLAMIHEEDRRALDAVTPELPHVAEAVRRITDAFRRGGPCR